MNAELAQLHARAVHAGSCAGAVASTTMSGTLIGVSLATILHVAVAVCVGLCAHHKATLTFNATRYGVLPCALHTTGTAILLIASNVYFAAIGFIFVAVLKELFADTDAALAL